MTASPVVVHPGPPEYTYAARFISLAPNAEMTLDIALGHIGPGLRTALDVDFGFGLRREAGWLVRRTPVRLTGITQAYDRCIEDMTPALRDMIPPDGKLIIQVNRFTPVEVEMWVYQQSRSVNEQLSEAGFGIDAPPAAEEVQSPV